MIITGITLTDLAGASETSVSEAKLRKLLNRLDHVVALWDADDPMGAYQVLVQSIRDARER